MAKPKVKELFSIMRRRFGALW